MNVNRFKRDSKQVPRLRRRRSRHQHFYRRRREKPDDKKLTSRPPKAERGFAPAPPQQGWLSTKGLKPGLGFKSGNGRESPTADLHSTDTGTHSEGGGLPEGGRSKPTSTSTRRPLIPQESVGSEDLGTRSLKTMEEVLEEPPQAKLSARSHNVKEDEVFFEVYRAPHPGPGRPSGSD